MVRCGSASPSANSATTTAAITDCRTDPPTGAPTVVRLLLRASPAGRIDSPAMPRTYRAMTWWKAISDMRIASTRTNSASGVMNPPSRSSTANGSPPAGSAAVAATRSVPTAMPIAKAASA